MALAITAVDQNKGTASSFVSASITVAAGDLVVILFGLSSWSATYTIAGLGTTWTPRTGNGPQATLQSSLATGTAPAGTTGTITVTFNGSYTYLYQILKVTGTAPVYVTPIAIGATGQSSPNVGVMNMGVPPANYAAITGWAILTGAAITPAFTPDTGWSIGGTQTLGSTYGFATQWAATDAPPINSTWTWASGTAAVSAVGILVADAGPFVLAAPFTPRVYTQHTIGAGGWIPSRMLHAGVLPMLAGAGIPGVSGTAAGRDDTLGSPNPPSFRMGPKGVLGPFDWPVDVGQHTITARAFYTPDDGVPNRPRLIVRGASELGLATDLISVAPASTGAFVNFPTITVAITWRGVLAIWFDFLTGRADGTGTAGSPRVYANIDRIRTS